MTTQSLRGMANHGPMHWRGDRTGGTDATRLVILPSAQPDTGTFDEQIAFKKFNVAFAGLLGRSGPLADDQMQAFTDFILQVTYPPNPIRHLDNSLTPDEQVGRDFFFSQTADGQELPSDLFHNCNGCHVLDPLGNAAFGVAKPRLLRQRRSLLVRGRDPVLQGPAPAQSLPEGRDVRDGVDVQSQRHQRSAGVPPAALQRNDADRRSSAWLRVPARRQRRHRVPLPRGSGVRANAPDGHLSGQPGRIPGHHRPATTPRRPFKSCRRTSPCAGRSRRS